MDMDKVCKGCLSYERIGTKIVENPEILYGSCPGYNIGDINCPCQYCLVKGMCNNICEDLKKSRWFIINNIRRKRGVKGCNMSIDNNEKLKHIESINESIDWLIENGLWDDVKNIMKYCVTKAANNVTEKIKNLEKGKTKLDSEFEFIDFGKSLDGSTIWDDFIKDILKDKY